MRTNSFIRVTFDHLGIVLFFWIVRNTRLSLFLVGQATPARKKALPFL